jgi:hypothetical protein
MKNQVMFHLTSKQSALLFLNFYFYFGKLTFEIWLFIEIFIRP